MNDIVKYVRPITLRDVSGRVNPEHLPDEIEQIMLEGNACLAAGCYNAAAAMFRLALDTATKKILPIEEGSPAKIARSLGLRLEWLFEHGLLSSDLRGLAECVQQDGNDGAHDGTIQLSDAEDLQDFSFEMMRRLYTEPKRLQLASERREKRRREN